MKVSWTRFSYLNFQIKKQIQQFKIEASTVSSVILDKECIKQGWMKEDTGYMDQRTGNII